MSRRAMPMTLHDAMRAADYRRRMEPWPRAYYWSAVWWRLHARESANPKEPLRYSRSQMALYRDILQQPEHYANRHRPHGVSDWQWSGLAAGV